MNLSFRKNPLENTNNMICILCLVRPHPVPRNKKTNIRCGQSDKTKTDMVDSFLADLKDTEVTAS